MACGYCGGGGDGGDLYAKGKQTRAGETGNALWKDGAQIDRFVANYDALIAKEQEKINELDEKMNDISGRISDARTYGNNPFYWTAGLILAVVDNASVVFNGWSDGSEANPRTDAEVMSDLTVIASFLSQGGADLDWYAAHGIAPESGEDWNDVDDRVVATKGTTLRHENIADTDPADTNDVFRVLTISNGPPLTVQFQPGSTGRVYTFQYTEDLTPPESWIDVPGVPPRPGAGGTDEMQDTGSDPDRQIHYRIEVQVP